MTVDNVAEVAQRVSDEVSGGQAVEPHPWSKVAARELTVEFDAQGYQEVDQAFNAFRRMTGVEAGLDGYTVRTVDEDGSTKARVSATVRVGGNAYVGHGVADDVVTGSVWAFASAIGHASAA